MSFHLPKHKLTYVSVPKSACTSLKRFFFHVHTGFRFRPFTINGETWHVHKFAQSVAFEQLKPSMMEGHRKIAVIRDPVGRVVSCYSNKVIDERLLRKPWAVERLETMGLTPTPTISEFIRDLPGYREASPGVRHHSEQLSYFLGKDPAFYDRLFSMRELPDLVDYVADIVGEVPKLPHAQKSASANVSLELTEEDRQRVEEMFAEDRALFGSWM